MPDRIANKFILVEDLEQQNLVRRYLEKCGHRDFRFAPLPAKSAGGSGEKYVRDQYAAQVKALRSAIGKKVRSILIVMIDADKQETNFRQHQLAESLKNAGMAARGQDEPIVVLIPKRHVETWIRALLGAQVDEKEDYKSPAPTSAEIKQSADKLYEVTRPNAATPEQYPPSLKASIPEWQRIP